MARPTPGTVEAEICIALLRDWSQRAFVALAWGNDELRVGACVPQGVVEYSSPLPRVPVATYAVLLGEPVEAAPREWCVTGVRPAAQG